MSRTINIWIVKHYSNECSASIHKQSTHLSNALPFSPRKRLGTRKKRKRESMNNQLHFGIQAPQQHISYQRLLEIWLEADREPLIDHMWLFDLCWLLGTSVSKIGGLFLEDLSPPLFLHEKIP